MIEGAQLKIWLMVSGSSEAYGSINKRSMYFHAFQFEGKGIDGIKSKNKWNIFFSSFST